MNPFDIIIITILAYCVIRGFMRGLLREISSIVGVIGGLYAAYSLYQPVAKTLAGWIKNPSYLNIISFLLVFCLVFIAINLLGTLIRQLMKIAFLGGVDRTCGVIFGLTKGVLIIAMLLLIFTAFLPRESTFIKKSVLSPYFIQISDKMSYLVSKELKKEFSDKKKEIVKLWKNYT